MKTLQRLIPAGLIIVSFMIMCAGSIIDGNVATICDGQDIKGALRASIL